MHQDQWSHYLGALGKDFVQAPLPCLRLPRLGSSGVLSPIFQTRWKATKQAENQVRLAVTRTFQTKSISTVTRDTEQFGT